MVTMPVKAKCIDPKQRCGKREIDYFTVISLNNKPPVIC
jgi:hypothetical protein